MKPVPVSKILKTLDQLYPNAKSALDFKTPLQALVAAILAAQSRDDWVNQITPALFKKYPRAHDYVRARPEELEEDIHRVNFYRNKAKSIRGCCATLVERYGGEVPKTMEELVDLPGVGRKTANMVLGNCFDIPGIITDTHVIRLSYRLGLTKETKPEKIETDLMKLIPKTRWTLFSHQISNHGRTICKAPTPFCSRCEFEPFCPKAGVKKSK
jgi:endonuclease-3